MTTMRLDKFLTELNLGSRSKVKELISGRLVTVNQKIVTKPETKIDPQKDRVFVRGQEMIYEAFQYYMLNKPQGVVSATRDKLSETVLSLLPEGHRGDLFPVGRLDKDTEGLLLITNDGELAHQLLSPKKHVSKTYLVKAASPISPEKLQMLKEGLDIGDEEKTLPAVAVLLPEKNSETWLRLTIKEGRYHQVKRMLHAIENEVLFLKRVRFGSLLLDSKLSGGDCRKLLPGEVDALRHAAQLARQKKELLARKKAVIFDMDGSLIDSMWVWGAIDKEYLGRFGISLEDRGPLKKQIEGKSFHETAVFFKDFYQIPDDIEKMKEDWNQMAWDKYEREVPLKEGVLEFLAGCREAGIRLGIATSNSRELVDTVLSSLDIQECFQVIVTGSEVTKGKPAPDIYLKVAKELGVMPQECLVFEDIVPGILSGKNAGMTVCAVADPDSEDTLLEKKELADFYVEDFYDFFD